MSNQTVSMETFQMESAALRAALKVICQSIPHEIDFKKAIDEASSQLTHTSNPVAARQHVINVIESISG